MNTVKVRNLVLGDGVPKICVPVIAHTYEELEKTLEKLGSCYFDMIEFRSDFYFDEDEPGALEAVMMAGCGRPVLYTLRTAEEGGEIEISDDLYERRILSAAGVADMVDIQYARLRGLGGEGKPYTGLVSRVHDMGAKVVLSWHDFEHTPNRQKMLDMMEGMQKEGGDITKIAVMPGSRRDVLELMEASIQMLEEKADRPFINKSMGRLGKVTRAACAFTGSCISFGTASGMSAPGQIRSDVLRTLLRELS